MAQFLVQKLEVVSGVEGAPKRAYNGRVHEFYIRDHKVITMDHVNGLGDRGLLDEPRVVIPHEESAMLGDKPDTDSSPGFNTRSNSERPTARRDRQYLLGFFRRTTQIWFRVNLNFLVYQRLSGVGQPDQLKQFKPTRIDDPIFTSLFAL